jgi:hypothetical protein
MGMMLKRTAKSMAADRKKQVSPPSTLSYWQIPNSSIARQKLDLEMLVKNLCISSYLIDVEK